MAQIDALRARLDELSRKHPDQKLVNLFVTQTTKILDTASDFITKYGDRYLDKIKYLTANLDKILGKITDDSVTFVKSVAEILKLRATAVIDLFRKEVSILKEAGSTFKANMLSVLLDGLQNAAQQAAVQVEMSEANSVIYRIFNSIQKNLGGAIAVIRENLHSRDRRDVNSEDNLIQDLVNSNMDHFDDLLDGIEDSCKKSLAENNEANLIYYQTPVAYR